MTEAVDEWTERALGAILEAYNRLADVEERCHAHTRLGERSEREAAASAAWAKRLREEHDELKRESGQQISLLKAQLLARTTALATLRSAYYREVVRIKRQLIMSGAVDTRELWSAAYDLACGCASYRIQAVGSAYRCGSTAHPIVCSGRGGALITVSYLSTCLLCHCGGFKPARRPAGCRFVRAVYARFRLRLRLYRQSISTDICTILRTARAGQSLASVASAAASESLRLSHATAHAGRPTRAPPRDGRGAPQRQPYDGEHELSRLAYAILCTL